MRTAGQSNGYGLWAGLHTISSMVAVLSLDGLCNLKRIQELQQYCRLVEKYDLDLRSG